MKESYAGKKAKNHCAIVPAPFETKLDMNYAYYPSATARGPSFRISRLDGNCMSHLVDPIQSSMLISSDHF